MPVVYSYHTYTASGDTNIKSYITLHLFDSTLGSINAYLPRFNDVIPVQDGTLIIVRRIGGGNSVTINPGPGDTIKGHSSINVNNADIFHLVATDALDGIIMWEPLVASTY